MEPIGSAMLYLLSKRTIFLYHTENLRQLNVKNSRQLVLDGLLWSVIPKDIKCWEMDGR